MSMASKWRTGFRQAAVGTATINLYLMVNSYPRKRA